MPVNRLLLSLSLPMMGSMLVQALYNVVDSIFVSRISEGALTAVSLAFPVQTLMIALGVGTGVGVNALLSRSLGEKNQEKANQVAVHAVFLGLMNYLTFLLIGLFLVGPFFMSQTTDDIILNFGIDYSTIICCFSIGMYTQFTFERLLQSTGKTMYSMITQLIGAVINILLDPILIFGLFGFPRLEVAGAAIATITGQIVAGIVGAIFNMKVNHEIQLSFNGFKPSFPIIRQIYAVGIPSIIMQSIGSVMVYGMNIILMAFSSTAAAVFGVYFKLQSFIFMPIFGLNNGMIPIIAYNFGAKNKERILKTRSLSIRYAVAIMAVGTLIFQLIPDKLFLLFDASPHMLSMGVPALRIISIHFVLAAYTIVSGSVFQALGNGIYSMITSICRQLVVLLPAAYLLSLPGEVNYVWLAFPIAELVSVALNIFFMKRINQQVLSGLDPA
ncbi:MAG: MATE family efflux transporter [Lachnospiraceae bacterium]|nr:MATE family efflux transporter [Lachnospiraceae bacterium]MDD7027782.1 MATE family efflux transporter [Lachnospiraceae bacterium]MDY5699857.1 MATE family efflux transporter [Lachnospiraceae bacterium]